MSTIMRLLVSSGFEGDEGEGFGVGFQGVTRIEEFSKSGMHSDIPYIRVWKGEHLLAEFCQHNVVGVYFSVPE